MGKRNKIAKAGMSKKNYQAVLNKNKNKSMMVEESIGEIEKSVEEEQIKSSEPKPLRHRRNVRKDVLSKGQRRRQEKKDKFKRREVLVEKIKLNQSMINTTMNKSMAPNISKTNNFDLVDLDSTLVNLMSVLKDTPASSDNKTNNKTNSAQNNVRKKKNRNNLM